jgi:hypothetical protein
MSDLTEHAISVFVFDKNGTAIPGATVQAFVGGELVAEATTKGSLDSPVRLQFSAQIHAIDIKATVGSVNKRVTVDAEAGTYRFDFTEVVMPRPIEWEKIVAVAAGVIFVSTMLVIAIKIPNPTPSQYTTFRIVLALACAAFASMIPGVLNVSVGTFVKAGGALAVFVVVYFYSPAGLVVTKPAEPRPTDPFTIYLVYPNGAQLAESSYSFPYSDIKKNRDFQSFMGLVKKLPDQQYNMPADSVIFRVVDEQVVDATNGDDVTSEGNTAVIVVPPAVVGTFPDRHVAFTYLHSMLPQPHRP